MRSNCSAFAGRKLFAAAVAACASFGLAGSAMAVTSPYSVDFTTGGQPTDFSVSTTTNASSWPATWTITGSPTVWENVLPGPGNGEVGTTNQNLTTSGVAGTNFVESAEFTVPTFSATGGTPEIGFVALSNSATTGTYSGSANWYTAGLSLTSGGDSLNIAASNGGGGASLGSSANPFTFATNTLYDLQLAGTYTGGSLSLQLSVINVSSGLTVGTVTSSAIATPFTGTLFGLHDASSGSGSATVDFSNYSLSPAAVPEPASLSLLAIGSLGLLARRRRQV